MKSNSLDLFNYTNRVRFRPTNGYKYALFQKSTFRKFLKHVFFLTSLFYALLNSSVRTIVV